MIRLLLLLLVLQPVIGLAQTDQKILKVDVFDRHQFYYKHAGAYRLAWDVLNEATRRSNIKLVTTEQAWTRTINGLQAGTVDAAFAAVKTPERDVWADFSYPLSTDFIHVFSHKDNPVKKLADINKKTALVGVSKDSVQHRMAEKMGFDNIYAMVDRSALYKMLLVNRLEFLIYSKSFVNIYCVEYFPGNEKECVKPVGKPLSFEGVHMMFNQKNTDVAKLVDEINQSIISMRDDGTIKHLFAKNDFTEAQYKEWLDMMPKKETIDISSIDWCPQICPGQEKPGYVIDIVNEVFKNSQYDLNIQTYPWSRAINNTTSGNTIALLSPAKKEAPQLVYPNEPVGAQTMCFFTEQDSSWRYKNKHSLRYKQIGIATDTSIEELNGYIKMNKDQFQFQPYHERYVFQNAQKLLKGRIDAFLMTKNTTHHELAVNNLQDKVKEAGCVSQADIYLAFTPAQKKSKKVAELVSFFDKRMRHLNDTGVIDGLLARYGITNNFTISTPQAD